MGLWFLSFLLLAHAYGGDGVVCLFLFVCFVADMGRRRRCETPTMTAQAGPGVGKGYTGGKLASLSRGACPRGQRQAAAVALRAACSGILDDFS